MLGQQYDGVRQDIERVYQERHDEVEALREQVKQLQGELASCKVEFWYWMCWDGGLNGG